MSFRIAVCLLFFTVSIWASESSRQPESVVPVSKPGDRLSWAPRVFLKKGFRNAPWVHDPFFPESRTLHLSGIISNEMAYINGRWLRLGETIEGFEIREILRGQVKLVRRGETVTLHLSVE